MPTFTSVAHIAFRVRDLDTSLEFYGKLGFPEFLRLTNDDGSPWIVYLKVTDHLFLELFPGGEESQVAQGKTGVDHLSLDTPDIEATIATLAAAGIPLNSPFSGERGADGNRGCWITDPDGNRIEIMEMAPNCIQFDAIKALNAGQGATSLLKPLG